ncbi:MAG: type IV pilus assembly protein PilM, partial [Isosphaeraceae bacterium]|nr:type IV pilus assembly protein PilM [Isosphaeraceae bacterium]
MAKIQAVWAIDIGQAALKALKLVPGEGADQVVAEAFDYIEYPKILSQPDADPEELVREALATFLERNDLKGCKVAIGVAGQAGLVKFIKLPPVEKKRIPDIVKFEARQQIPFALEEVIWDYQQIGDTDKDKDEEEGGFTMAEVGLFAMKRDQIQRAMLPFKNAGIEVDLVQMGPIALYNFAAFDRFAGRDGEAALAADEEAPAEKPKKKADKDKGSVVLLDIGADNTDLIITDGMRIWQRNVPIGGNHFTRALTKELKLTFAKAEHLKRNATKAPDPRAVFTAMRGVFNDFASEVNRSIGFYSSVNRTAKIVKVIGLGNGFKLPGLQKFLQQNLSYEVEKLEGFARLTGEEVTSAPQFQENVMSFAVAYGLALQGLGKGQLRTNLLPPEIEQVRMIRRKKPWALAASALLMLGFSALFFSDFRAWAKVNNDQFKQAVERAKSVSQQGASYQQQYDAAKAEFEKKKSGGQALVADSADTTDWAALLQKINAVLPDPAREIPGLDPNAPKNANLLSILQVHIDAIKPVWREDLGANWFNTDVKDFQKGTMHPYDQKNPPAGPGWVIQIVGHHYNPHPSSKTKLTEREKQYAKGPLRYLQEVVLPRLGMPQLRQYGLSHASVAWMNMDPQWTTAKGASGPTVPPAPLLEKAKPPAPPARGGPGGYGGEGYGAPGGAMAGGYGGMPGEGYGAPGGYGYGMMGPSSASKKDQASYKYRTDFKIELVWKPPAPDAPPKPIADIQKELAEAAKDLSGVIAPMSEDQIAEASQKVFREALQKELGGAAPAPGAQAPGTTPAPGAQALGGATPNAAPPAAGTPPAGAPPAPGATP